MLYTWGQIEHDLWGQAFSTGDCIQRINFASLLCQTVVHGMDIQRNSSPPEEHRNRFQFQAWRKLATNITGFRVNYEFPFFCDECLRVPLLSPMTVAGLDF